MNKVQQQIIDEWINTSNYVYNKTIEKINKGHSINFMNLRDLLVTNNTKKNSDEYNNFNIITSKLKLEKKNIYEELNKNKSCCKLQEQLRNKQVEIENINQERRDAVKIIKAEKNIEVELWETRTPKEIRAGAIEDVCKAYKTAFANLKAHNITFFNLSYRKKTNPNKCIVISKKLIKINENNIELAPTFLKDNKKFSLSKATLKKNKHLFISGNMNIEYDVRLVKQKNKYYLFVPISIQSDPNNTIKNYCGIDPGVRTFMTSFGNNNYVEYNHNKIKLDKLNKEIDILKNKTHVLTYPNLKNQSDKNIKCEKRRKEILNKQITKNMLKQSTKRIRKRQLNKRENKKSNIINEVHWKTINHLLYENDVIFYGDINSHNIVKHKENKKLNRNTNDLKFYLFKQRLLYKAETKNKYVICINEAFTTQTCSFCGCLNNPECSKIYNCLECHKQVGRDVNAAKNILMKGIITTLL
jgi:IS605 OrfB family transposase